MSSKKSSAVSLDLLPIFFSAFETVKPLVFVGTRKKEQPCAPASGLVFASSVMKSARVPFVMKVFWPLMT
jgi:hypothetical protein